MSFKGEMNASSAKMGKLMEIQCMLPIFLLVMSTFFSFKGVTGVSALTPEPTCRLITPFNF